MSLPSVQDCTDDNHAIVSPSGPESTKRLAPLYIAPPVLEGTEKPEPILIVPPTVVDGPHSAQEGTKKPAASSLAPPIATEGTRGFYSAHFYSATGSSDSLALPPIVEHKHRTTPELAEL
ncbi:hypothetical protein SRHO_G00016940 [Serrasalmus rhombeus]